jgi:hypothetical protein
MEEYHHEDCNTADQINLPVPYHLTHTRSIVGIFSYVFGIIYQKNPADYFP